MYGVPDDLDLSGFRGSTLVQVCHGEHQVQFRFAPEGEIAVEGRWDLEDESGASEALLSPPDWFALRFGNGLTLRIWDDSDQHETIQIAPGGIVI